MSPKEEILAKIARYRTMLRSMRRLMGRIGRILLMDSKRAFPAQGLGDIDWPERYPSQRGARLNIAGALSDFIAGAGSPKPSRFSPRPALIDTGALQRSVKSTIIDETTVEISSDLRYAQRAQSGGTTEQSYGQDTRQRIAQWLFERDGQGREVVRSGLAPYLPLMRRLLHKSVHRQTVIARPFIGLTDDAEARIRQEVERYFAGR